VAVCIAAASRSADRPGNTKAKGAAVAGDRARADNARGQIILGACSVDADCKGKRTCAGGYCAACGGPGQPCCGAPQPCRKYGRGRGDLACVFSAAAGIGICTSPPS
jgi:hypothetical protein